MWPYEEYTLLENILVLVIPYLFLLIVYFLLRPVLEKKIGNRTIDLNDKLEDQNPEHWRTKS